MRKFNTIICCALSLMLVFVNIITVNAFNSSLFLANEIEKGIYQLENKIVSVKKSKLLKDISFEDNYTLFEFNEGGYAIIANESYVISEYALGNDFKIPYSNSNDSQELIYGGPYNYIAKTADGKFVDTMTNQLIDFEVSNQLIKINEEIISREKKEIETRVSGPTKWRGIEESKFKNYNSGKWINSSSNYPNTNGVCGHIALAILMAYYQDNINTKYVPSSIRSKGSSTPGKLIDELIKIIGKTSSGTIATDLYKGYNSFNDKYGITLAIAQGTLGSTWDVVKKQLDKNQSAPVVVGMTKIAGSPYGNHWVTVYAYGTDNKDKGYYKAIDNHGKYNVTIETSWTVGAMWLSK